jgi:hypothetical protein
VYRALLTISEWVAFSCSLTPAVLDCRLSQPKSTQRRRKQSYPVRYKELTRHLPTSCYCVRLQILQSLPETVRQPNFSWTQSACGG